MVKKKVFSKELEWFQTVSVFIFTAKSAHFKQFCFSGEGRGVLPLVAESGIVRFLDID